MAGGRPLYKLGKSMGSKTIEEMDLPKQAFAMIPMSDVFDRVTKKLSELLGEMKNQRGRTRLACPLIEANRPSMLQRGNSRF
jgi:hypothetical protein